MPRPDRHTNRGGHNYGFGYTSNNVQWVHKKVNIMKNVMSNSELLEWCKRLLSIGNGLPLEVV